MRVTNTPWGHTSWHWDISQRVCSLPGARCTVCCCWPEVASLAAVEDVAVAVAITKAVIWDDVFISLLPCLATGWSSPYSLLVFVSELLVCADEPSWPAAGFVVLAGWPLAQAGRAEDSEAEPETGNLNNNIEGLKASRLNNPHPLPDTRWRTRRSSRGRCWGSPRPAGPRSSSQTPDLWQGFSLVTLGLWLADTDLNTGTPGELSSLPGSCPRLLEPGGSRVLNVWKYIEGKCASRHYLRLDALGYGKYIAAYVLRTWTWFDYI